MASDPLIRPLTVADVPATTALLVRCFADDPGYAALFPDAQREAMLGFMMDRLLRMRLEAGSTVWVVDDDGPVATLTFAPDHIRFGLGQYLRHGLVWMPLRFGLAPVRRMLAADEQAGALRKAHAPAPPHIWFAQVAVDQGYQGRGLARALWSRALAQVDEQGLAAATMTTRPELVETYGHEGFQARGEVETHGFTTWLLVRPSREG